MSIVLWWLSIAPSVGVTAPTSPKYAVKKIAALNADLTKLDALQRITDDLVFQQTVSIMGGEYDWHFRYNSAGTELVAWTIRLSQSLDQTSYEGARVAQSIKRRRLLINGQKETVLEAYEIISEIHAHGKDIHTLLISEENALAGKNFNDEVIDKRREFSRSLGGLRLSIVLLSG